MSRVKSFVLNVVAFVVAIALIVGGEALFK